MNTLFDFIKMGFGFAVGACAAYVLGQIIIEILDRIFSGL